MPEGDTVHQLARRLASLEGRRLTHAELRVPAMATLDLRGRTVSRVSPWGKNLYLELVAHDDVDLVLHTHLRMEGTWLINAAATAPVPSHETRVWLRVEGRPEAAAEVDLQGRLLGTVDVWPLQQLAQRTAHLGPDPLAADWLEPGRWDRPGRQEAADRLHQQAHRPLAEVLLDQSVVAGIGNVYANEMCFLLGSHPMNPAGIQDPDRVVDLAHHLMVANLPRPRRVFTGIDRNGERTFVHGRHRRPCRRCGTAIREGTTTQARSVADPGVGHERVTWWCPRCQPPP